MPEGSEGGEDSAADGPKIVNGSDPYVRSAIDKLTDRLRDR